MLVEEHLGRRAYHQPRGLPGSGLRDPLHPFLMCDIWRNTQELRHSHSFSRPLMRGDEVVTRATFDEQVAYMHGPAIHSSQKRRCC